MRQLVFSTRRDVMAHGADGPDGADCCARPDNKFGSFYARTDCSLEQFEKVKKCFETATRKSAGRLLTAWRRVEDICVGMRVSVIRS